MFSPLIDQLINSLRHLPGVGPKSAQRMALHLLERDREGAQNLSEVLAKAVEHVHRCQQCRTLTEQALCNICSNARRNRKELCIVETPADVIAIETSAVFSGYYFVLLGRLSPIDGIGPKEIGMDVLASRFAEGEIEEVIVATNPTIEGEATAHYISERAKAQGIKVSRIAHGIPIGGELEYVDGGTLAHAISRRQEI
ncbi:recombination mediator RecR [Saccharophagus degradans]|uniref:recombination mediator RecR n=1 Tax=Saccharophagus degradans TaxID=86304 RepID=UPI001C07F9E9|nr:recombination mediator RecR [Saccharophagus degradans]MBU2985998.1 recombination mediator RecR [Saccharophagus degradans]